MNNKNTVCFTLVTGLVLAGFAGYLLGTEEGKKLGKKIKKKGKKLMDESADYLKCS